MVKSSSVDTTRLLHAWAGGDPAALQQLTPRVYRELRGMAAHYLRKERPGYTLQSAELVHEVYLRLVDADQVNWQDRAHFFAVAATLMRRILVDRARRRSAGKRGARTAKLLSGRMAVSICSMPVMFVVFAMQKRLATF